LDRLGFLFRIPGPTPYVVSTTIVVLRVIFLVQIHAANAVTMPAAKKNTVCFDGKVSHHHTTFRPTFLSQTLSSHNIKSTKDSTFFVALFYHSIIDEKLRCFANKSILSLQMSSV
jgi:hypothetical protein